MSDASATALTDLRFDNIEMVGGEEGLWLNLPDGVEDADVTLVIDLYQLEKQVHPDGHLGWWQFAVETLPKRALVKLGLSEDRANPIVGKSGPIGRWVNPDPVPARSWMVIAVLRRKTTNAIMATARVPVFLGPEERDRFRGRVARNWAERHFATASYIPARDVTVRILSRSVFPRDAVGNLCLDVYGLLLQAGFAVKLYATEFPLELNDVICHSYTLGQTIEREDMLLYFHSTQDPMLEAALDYVCARRITYFHGLTNPRLLQVFDPELAQEIEAGIEQVRLLSRFHVIATNSAMNANFLLERFDKDDAWTAEAIKVIPPKLMPPAIAVGLSEVPMGRRKALLTVGRLKSHKKIEDVLALFAAYRELDPEAECWIVGNDQDRPYREYLEWVERSQLKLPAGKVKWWGIVEEEQLGAAYASAAAYVSMSEDEGFGLPVLEAMLNGLPVFAYGVPPIVDILAGSGQYFDRKDMPHIAKVIHEVCSNASRREQMVERQRLRAAQIAAQMDGSGFLELFAPEPVASRK